MLVSISSAILLSEQSSCLTFGEIDLLQLDVSVGETPAYSLERLTYIEKFLSRDKSTSAKMIFPVIFFLTQLREAAKSVITYSRHSKGLFCLSDASLETA